MTNRDYRENMRKCCYHRHNLDYWAALRETKEILKDKSIMEQIKQSEKDIKEGRIISTNEFFRELDL